jgi:hypothetical protein
MGVKKIMNDVSAVNFIRSWGLNHRQFKVFLDEIKSEYGDKCTSVKFTGLAKVKFCNVYCHY